MQTIPIRERGLVATLFLPSSVHPLPLIIVLGGFRGGLPEPVAMELAEQGFAALALAYFRAQGLPADLENIPLEYFEKVFDWVKSYPFIAREKIALLGISRGAELSLLLGTVFPEEMQAIAALLPSSAIYGSIQNASPAWIYRGKPLKPNAPLPPLSFQGEDGQDETHAIKLTPFFLAGMQDLKTFEASQIPVEKIQCPLFLVSAGDDQMWPSTVFAKQITKRLEEYNSSIPCTHVDYPKAGHSISSSEEIAELHPIVKLWFAKGGSPEDNAIAKIDCWRRTLGFFKKTLLSLD